MTQSPGPLIVQGDLTILAEVDNPGYEEARDCIAPFTELVKSPEHIHTYAISPLSLWNASSAGHTPENVVQTLERFSRYPIPQNVIAEVNGSMGQYGKVRILKKGNHLVLEVDEPALLEELMSHKKTAGSLQERIDETHAIVTPFSRGTIKVALTEIGFPAEDRAGYTVGTPLPIALRTQTREGKKMALREYQQEAVQVFHSGGSDKGGSGVVVLPCGAGKTVVGMAAMAMCQTETLVLTTNVTAARQWIREIVDKTTLEPDQVSEYTGSEKSIASVTVATYQILTYRKRKTEEYPHFHLFEQKRWGLIVYDEVHLLPAPVFRISADMQATRRLGLTATLIREDGKQKEVFSLIGPKKYDVPWKVLEKQGWIATAFCHEIRVGLKAEEKMNYAMSQARKKITIAACNPEKMKVVQWLLQHHAGDRIMLIGHYLDQLDQLQAEIDAPLITGATKADERDRLFHDFRSGANTTLIVSKVGNFAIDIPDANVLIQVSGTFGSRQEEARRLGRLLRPKANGSMAHFYTIVTRETKEQEFAMKRQLFLAEQGYKYSVQNAESVVDAKTQNGSN